MTHTAQEPGSLFWCHPVASLQFTSFLCLQKQVTKLASGLFQYWPLLH